MIICSIFWYSMLSYDLGTVKYYFLSHSGKEAREINPPNLYQCIHTENFSHFMTFFGSKVLYINVFIRICGVIFFIITILVLTYIWSINKDNREVLWLVWMFPFHSVSGKKNNPLRISCQWVQIQHITKYHQQKNVVGSALVQSACTCVWKRYNEIMP